MKAISWFSTKNRVNHGKRKFSNKTAKPAIPTSPSTVCRGYTAAPIPTGNRDKKKVDKLTKLRYIYSMIIRDSESRALAAYCLLIFALALVLPYVVVFFLPISFYILPCVLTQKSQHYNSRLNSNFIPRSISMRGPPLLVLL